MRVIVGCDGGGSKCKVRVEILDEDGELICCGSAVSGNANVRSEPDLALQHLKMAFDRAAEEAGLDRTIQIDAMVGAFAGAGTQTIQDRWAKLFDEHFSPRHVRVIPDVVALFAAAKITRYPVVACVIGTGSIAWSKQASGAMDRAGGLGPKVGDEGSGYWIGHQALRRMNNTPRDIQMRELALDRFGERSIDQLSVSEAAGFSKDVFAIADVNALARQIVQEATVAISDLLTELAIEFPSGPASRLTWLIAGGVAINQPAWIEQIRRRCEKRNVFLDTPQRVEDPVIGAIVLAKKVLH